jgi:hypothetical protein
VLESWIIKNVQQYLSKSKMDFSRRIDWTDYITCSNSSIFKDSNNRRTEVSIFYSCSYGRDHQAVHLHICSSLQ